MEMSDREGAFNISLVDTIRADLEKSGSESPGSLTEHMLGIKKKYPKALEVLVERHFAGVPNRYARCWCRNHGFCH